MARLLYLPILLASLLSCLLHTSAQSSGTITVSSPGSCIIIGQAATLGTPFVLTEMVSVCPQDGTKTIDWPLTTSGDGSSSDMVFYAQLSTSGSTTTPGCVLTLTQMQAMYCLGRSLQWKSDVNEVYDNTAGGILVDPTSYQPIVW